MSSARCRKAEHVGIVTYHDASLGKRVGELAFVTRAPQSGVGRCRHVVSSAAQPECDGLGDVLVRVKSHGLDGLAACRSFVSSGPGPILSRSAWANRSSSLAWS